jgi:hypothetical protein
MISAHKEISSLIRDALEEGVDYGVIPGTEKPTLYKPGAERLAIAFGCSISTVVVSSEVDHDRPTEWRKRTGSGVSLGVYRFTIRCDLTSRSTGEVVGSGVGCCSSLESKYCDRPRDLENTVLKMAKKRALVDAVLTTFGLSSRFTQDLEDDNASAEEESRAGAAREKLQSLSKNPALPVDVRSFICKTLGGKPSADTLESVALRAEEVLSRKAAEVADGK